MKKLRGIDSPLSNNINCKILTCGIASLPVKHYRVFINSASVLVKVYLIISMIFKMKEVTKNIEGSYHYEKYPVM